MKKFVALFKNKRDGEATEQNNWLIDIPQTKGNLSREKLTVCTEELLILQ
ncbi:hypothetical protein SAMN05877753_102692 [Bacillus oleivorans]|uniref:Uncharacterized protein n=1 Tax=Bacillus oleivorans TaxID=1448271 RepID=A0A285CNT7_9BACI|nr:hypothetical protein [Bacillus oleivorans]SNX68718.1 hypothetical protein SAMN05877753_102692 [Bacillus oleivorans]